jgi:hypothetical protein
MAVIADRGWGRVAFNDNKSLVYFFCLAKRFGQHYIVEGSYSCYFTVRAF